MFGGGGTIAGGGVKGLGFGLGEWKTSGEKKK